MVSLCLQLGRAYGQFLNSDKAVKMPFSVGGVQTKRSVPVEPPKRMTVRSRNGGAKEVSMADDSGSDIVVDDSIDSDAPARTIRATRSLNGPPVRGSVKQQALATLKAKRQLNELPATGNSSVEDCYGALLLLKVCPSFLPTQAVVTSFLCEEGY